jgi:hypothetical protein
MDSTPPESTLAFPARQQVNTYTFIKANNYITNIYIKAGIQGFENRIRQSLPSVGIPAWHPRIINATSSGVKL